jgi:hypothetical protein
MHSQVPVLCGLELPAGRWNPVEENLSGPERKRAYQARRIGLRFEHMLMTSREKNTAAARRQQARVGVK